MGEENKDFDIQKIKELLELMETHNLVEIEVVNGDEKILLKRAKYQTTPIPQPMIEQHPIKNDRSDKNFKFIKSPMPATFYAAINPDSEPYVKIGSEITPETTVCILDSMKVITEIKAEITGTIAEVLAKNGQAVWRGTPLFKVKVN